MFGWKVLYMKQARVDLGCGEFWEGGEYLGVFFEGEGGG